MDYKPKFDSDMPNADLVIAKEAWDYLNQNPETLFSFIRYYKYEFTYEAHISLPCADGKGRMGVKIKILIGGDHDDIYRSELLSSETFRSLKSNFYERFIITRELATDTDSLNNVAIYSTSFWDMP